MTDKQRLRLIMRRLEQRYPAARTALDFATPFQLLVATILSAQTTDALVNKVTKGLFRKYPAPADFAATDPEEIGEAIRSVNYFKTKARNICSVARILIDRHGGNVPRSMEGLVSLPGVARKTANVVLYNAFGINEGIAVDTHVKRLSGLLGLSAGKDAEKVERDLMALAPREKWGELSHLLILHGRQVCRANNARHDECVIRDLCPSGQEGPPESGQAKGMARAKAGKESVPCDFRPPGPGAVMEGQCETVVTDGGESACVAESYVNRASIREEIEEALRRNARKGRRR